MDIGVRIVPLARFTSPPCVYGKEITTRGKHAPESLTSLVSMLLINLQYDAPLSGDMEGLARPMSQDVVQPATGFWNEPL